MKRLLVILALIAALGLLAAPAGATGNTVIKDDTSGVIEIVTDGATDLNFATDGTIKEPNGFKINSISSTSPATGNAVTIRTGSATGPRAYIFSATVSKDNTKAYGKKMSLYIKGSETTSGTVIIVDYFPDSWINRYFWITP